MIVSGPSLPEITCAASLAHHGLLGSVSEVMLRDVDLSSIPARHQASLASCVKTSVSIENVSGCDLVAILDSLNCQALRRLSVEETRALVQAMESGVEKVKLWPQVTLDIEALTGYSGQGVCRHVELQDDTMDRYKEEMVTWARSRKWRIHLDEDYLRDWSIIRKLSFTKMVITPV